MSSRVEQIEALFAELLARGWRRESDRLVAPYGTMWFETALDWPRSLAELESDMRSRRERIERSADEGSGASGAALSDVGQVIDALKVVIARSCQHPAGT